jgi:hypothetical protein
MFPRKERPMSKRLSKRLAPTPPKEYESFVAVRVDTGDNHEWFDTSYISGCLDAVREEAQKMDARIPGWAKANPVRRYARIRVAEVTTDA